MRNDDSDDPHFPPPGGNAGYRELQSRPPQPSAEGKPQNRLVQLDAPLLIEKKKPRRDWVKVVRERVELERRREASSALGRFVLFVLFMVPLLSWCSRHFPH